MQILNDKISHTMVINIFSTIIKQYWQLWNKICMMYFSVLICVENYFKIVNLCWFILLKEY